MNRQIAESDFKPDMMVAIGTGGFIPARMLRNFLRIPIITVGIAYYDLNDTPAEKPIITQWLDKPESQIKGRRILLVDEVDDTRATIGFCLDELFKHQPEEVAVAVLHNKNKPKAHVMPAKVKHVFHGLELADDWICYPWDADNIEEQDRLRNQA
ncbi:MAG: phosphoribosyltransferase [Spirochaetaceae bacterium]|jgi:hypoxanthine phosphoribosyltransferase|nr:phosphoribosyltransferase [Spirochaetaceae bacterium]